MDATLNVASKTTSGAYLAAAEKDDLKPVQAKSGKILLGDALKVINDRDFLAGFTTEDVSTQELVSYWIDQKFEAMKQVAKNMGVDEKQREEIERRLKELEELRKKIEDQMVDFKELVAKFEVLGISAGDKAALETALALENPAYV
jgi:DNA repair ATPase RecN